jgi:hypothetical protein
MDNVLDSGMNRYEMGLTESLKQSLYTQAYWGRILGITGMVFYGLFLIGIIFGGSFLMKALSMSRPELGAASTYLLIFYGAIIGFGLFMSYLLFNFGNKVKKGLTNDDINMVETGSKDLAKLFKITGIITIGFIVLYALIIVVALVGFSAVGR